MLPKGRIHQCVLLQKTSKGDDFLQNNPFICDLSSLDPELKNLTLIITGY